MTGPGIPQLVSSSAPTTTLRVPVVVVAIATGVGLLLAPGLLLGTPGVVRDFHQPQGPSSVLGIVGLVLIGLSWLSISASWPRKGKAIGLLAIGIVVLLVLVVVASTSGEWRIAAVILGPLATAAGVAGWLVLRGRPARSFLGLLLSPLAVTVALLPTYASTWIVAAVVPAIVAWLSWTLSLTQGGSEARRAEAAVLRGQATVESQAEAIRQWQAAYALANPGEPIPLPPVGIVVPAQQGTNTFAILALIFGVTGGLLAIVFGHIALSQIRRTARAGFGLAVAGLVLGYAWLAIILFSIAAPFFIVALWR
jgi:hypothetical protein